MTIVPIESSHSQLSIGTIFIKNGSILRKLWTNQSDDIFGGNKSVSIFSYQMRPSFWDAQNFLFGLFFETHRFAIQYTHTRFLKVKKQTCIRLMKEVPIESSHSQLSIGTIFIKTGSILRKLWVNQSDDIFGGNNSVIPLKP